LFCYFAEYTNIFEENQVTNAIDSYQPKDGSDLNTFLDTRFDVLNTPIENRSIKLGNLISDYLNEPSAVVSSIICLDESIFG
jgi:hypothetical protein